ncbi:MAG: class I SAM-dependent methyltransferase [Bacteroidetes bacterium]|nr:class I SAM-dependent methyltransferase [Bacteroidota bacterium]
MTEWFEEWFDTEYYHLLYNNRNDEEAAAFMRRICSYLGLPEGAKVADIACGKGRHSHVLGNFGFLVYGYDLSGNSICQARELASPNESFFVHDIREPFPHNGFDAAFNLFTSFGYFNSPAEDEQTLKNIYHMLKPGAVFVQDYLNGLPLLNQLPCQGSEVRNNLTFKLAKRYEAPFIYKTIHVEDSHGIHDFEEKVKIYSEAELRDLHTGAGFVVDAVCGNYELQPYEKQSSPRIILISRKPA